MSPTSSVHPWYRDDIKRKPIFHLRNLGRIFSIGRRRRRRCEDVAIHLHCGAWRHAALRQTKKKKMKKCVEITQHVLVWPSKPNPSYLWPHCVRAWIFLITGTATYTASHTKQPLESIVGWEGYGRCEHDGVGASTWNGFVPIWHPYKWPLPRLCWNPLKETEGGGMKNGRGSDRGPVRRTLTTLIWCIRRRVIMCTRPVMAPLNNNQRNCC